MLICTDVYYKPHLKVSLCLFVRHMVVSLCELCGWPRFDLHQIRLRNGYQPSRLIFWPSTERAENLGYRNKTNRFSKCSRFQYSDRKMVVVPKHNETGEPIVRPNVGRMALDMVDQCRTLDHVLLLTNAADFVK